MSNKQEGVMEARDIFDEKEMEESNEEDFDIRFLLAQHFIVFRLFFLSTFIPLSSLILAFHVPSFPFSRWLFFGGNKKLSNNMINQKYD